MQSKNIKNTKNLKIKVVVGLSGGVDSSVAAYLLQQQGYHVEALFMKNWEEDDTKTYCSAAQDIKDAQAVCDKLNIKLHIVNFAKEYWDQVFTYFLTEYQQGRTPNPDILCNKEIKFKAFLNYAIDNLQADYIATGHYARIAKINNIGLQNVGNLSSRSSAPRAEPGSIPADPGSTAGMTEFLRKSCNKLDKQDLECNYQLLKSLDNNKDQSYFLHALNQEQLAKSLFPVGEIDKPEIRAIAKSLNLITHDKKDSTGICFIGEVKFKKFLSKYLPAKPGKIIDENNNIIGQHDGLMYYTIGQRQGLNLGGLKNYSELPWYVASKDLMNNTLTVVQGINHKLLFKTCAQVINYNFIDPEFLLKLNKTNKNKELDIKIKARYRQADQLAKISLDNNSNNNSLLVTFNTPQRAITPGQAMVFYEQDICLGGGTIV